MAKDMQTPFDAAVVMFTKRTGALATAIRSVYAQTFDGRVQVVVGVDGPQADRAALAALAREAPDRMALTVVDPGYSTARSRGGLHAPEAGGSLRAALTLLANARHVAFLSEVNRYAPEHLDLLRRAIGEHAWAWTQRWFADSHHGLHEKWPDEAKKKISEITPRYSGTATGQITRHPDPAWQITEL